MHFIGKAIALPSNIRLGWKGLPGKNTLAYYKLSENYRRIMFCNICPSFTKLGICPKVWQQSKPLIFPTQALGYKTSLCHICNVV
jgi:hypothetical protein